MFGIVEKAPAIAPEDEPAALDAALDPTDCWLFCCALLCLESDVPLVPDWVVPSAAAPAEVARDPAGWMRARDDAASAAGWSPVGADGTLLAAHVDACVSMLRGATRPGAGAPDKRLLGATLTEAMRCANELAAEGEEGEEEEDDSDSDSDSDDDADDSDDDADRLENESEADFLERYAAIAHELAEKQDGGEEEDDEDAFDRDDDAFDRALTPTRGDGAESARTFRAWFAEWRAGGSSGARASRGARGPA